MNNLIYKHSIYKNKNKINEFVNRINDSEKSIRKKIIEIQEESEMRKKEKKK